MLTLGGGIIVSVHNYNINGLQSTGVRISRVRVVGGSTGIELNHCDGAHIANFIAMNVRGVRKNYPGLKCGPHQIGALQCCCTLILDILKGGRQMEFCSELNVV